MKFTNYTPIFLFCSCFANVDKMVKMPPKPTIITINNNVQQKMTVLNKIEKLFEPIKKQVSALPFSFPSVNKKSIFATAVVGSTVAIWSTVTTLLVLDARFIADINNWAYWQGSTPLALLKEQEQKNVAKQLFEAILQTYGFVNGDFLTPLADFMSTIKQEEYRYKRFIQWHYFLSTWRLAVLFPAQKDSMALAQNNLERLAFYRTILLQWILENKYETRFA